MDRIAYIINETFIYWSPILLTVGAVVAICFFLAFYLWKSGNGLAAACMVPMSLASSLYLSRLIHWYCCADSYAGMTAALEDLTVGSFALMGVFAACILCACLLRLLQISKNLPEMLDCVALGGAAGIAVGRLSCLFNTADRGMLIEGYTQLPWVYPVTNAVTGAQEYRLATFMLQAITTGVIFLVLALFWMAGQGKKKGKDGDTCLLFLAVYGACQIVLDSTRYDSLFMRSNGFVSIVQILGCVSVVLPAVVFSVRMVKAMRFRGWFLAAWLAVLGCLGGAGYMEYHVQRHGDQAAFAYSVMSGCLLAVVVLIVVFRQLAVTYEWRNMEEILPEAPAVETVAAVEPVTEEAEFVLE